jgi:hypothetical protein
MIIRVGLNLQYRINPLGPVDPWLGVGIGYEVLSSTASSDGTETTYTASGLEFANLQLGADLMATPRVRIGPYGRFSFAQYMTSNVQSDGSEVSSGPIENPALHNWLEFGLRIAYDL